MNEKIYRELTKKGDPIARMVLPSFIVSVLQENAKKNKRRNQDQLIKSLTYTLKNEAKFSEISEEALSYLKSLYENDGSKQH